MSTNIRATIEVELQPFTVPNFALIAGKPDAEGSARSIHLADLDAMTLDRMCREFRDAVFKKANRQPPPESR